MEHQGARTAKGYGRRWFRGSPWRAHRVAWVEAFGEIPDGLLVLHTCDNPPCVNPEHLFLGTHRDNALDRQAKGRSAKTRPKPHAYPLNPVVVVMDPDSPVDIGLRGPEAFRGSSSGPELEVRRGMSDTQAVVVEVLDGEPPSQERPQSKFWREVMEQVEANAGQWCKVPGNFDPSTATQLRQGRNTRVNPSLVDIETRADPQEDGRKRITIFLRTA